MNKNILYCRRSLLAAMLAAATLLPLAVQAQVVVNDTLTGKANTYPWTALNGACLTAGDGSGTIPACAGLSYYNGKTLVGGYSGRLPDPAGYGALRLTNGDTTLNGGNGNSQTGAVIGTNAFPATSGVQLTFTTKTYGGNGYSNAKGIASGADGITFFIGDASVLNPGTSTPATGAYGGSLGYSCSNNKPYPGNEGVPGAYLAVGIDEYGNFVNGGTVTQTTTISGASTTTVKTYTGTVLTDPTGVPTTNPPTWSGSTPTPTTSTITTASNKSIAFSTTVTNVPPNPTSATVAKGTSTTVSNWSFTQGNPTLQSDGTYTISATYTVSTAKTTGSSDTIAVSYSVTQGDNTASGVPGGGPQPGRVSVRGAGNVNLTWLRANYPALFPTGMSSSAIQTAIQQTCMTGFPYNNTGKTQTVNGTSVPNGQYYTTAVADYPLMATDPLPSGSTIYNQEAQSNPLRSKAVPITYSLSISYDGILNMSYSYNGGAAIPVIANQSISASNGKVPDNLRFGFSAGTGGGSNVHEITCFKASPMNVAATSVGLNAQQSAQVQQGTQLYLAMYHPTNWWGELTATTLSTSGGNVALNNLATWDASCVLTGGSCAGATGGTNVAQPTGTGAAAAGTRQLMTWQWDSVTGAGAGIPLQWSNLSTAQKAVLDLGDAMLGSPNADRLGWLRGDRQNEIGGNGSDAVFRKRNGVLGDIVDSSPTWVGPPSLPYKGPWRDALYPAATMPEGTSYAAFASSNTNRTNVVYVGANDGFMHGFRAGAITAAGTLSSSVPNDGLELIGYMPSSAFATIHNATKPTLDYSSPSYAHALSVDATPGSGDLYYNGAWHTWLVGGMGGGGNTNGPIGDNTTAATGGDIFALDITDPTRFSEANAAAAVNPIVIGDWGPNGSPMTCASSPSTACSAALLSNLGNTYGTPIVRRLHDGNWGVIFGNGFNSPTGTAGIYIMEVSSAGAITFRFLDTGYGPSKDPLSASNKNGIAYVSSADLDGDHVTDYVYAGDRFGNLWRFDLTSNNAVNWKVRSTPLFSTPVATVGSTVVSQPITTRVTVNSASGSSVAPRVMISFGTGQQLPQTLTSPTTYASGTQTLYGIWDWDMNAWNALGSTPYATLTAPQSITTATLQTQTATDVAGSNGNISGYRTVTQNKVCWSGSSTCGPLARSNTQYGWMLNLPDSSEQIIYNPTTAYGLFIVNTTIPATTSAALSCDYVPPSGYTMAIAVDTGGSPKSSFFASATNNYVSTNGGIVSGIGLGATGTPSFVSFGGNTYMVFQTNAGGGASVSSGTTPGAGTNKNNILQVNPGASGIGSRLTWVKLR